MIYTPLLGINAEEVVGVSDCIIAHGSERHHNIIYIKTHANMVARMKMSAFSLDDTENVHH